jgi:hypothetical protein
MCDELMAYVSKIHEKEDFRVLSTEGNRREQKK